MARPDPARAARACGQDRQGVEANIRTMRMPLQKRIDAWSEQLVQNPFERAWRAIAVVTVAVTIAGGALARLTDPDTIKSLGEGFWWALQTITTVGYGDVVPASTLGRVMAAFVMLAGLSFLAVTTAAVTNAFVQAAARRRGERGHGEVLAELARLRSELAELRADITAAAPPGTGDGPAASGTDG